MELTYTVVISFIALCLGAVTKAFINKVPSKYIPLQNLLIGIVSAIICVYTGIINGFLEALITCVTASMAAGGIYDLSKIKKED